MKEKILILSPFFRPNIGGVETHLDDLIEYLRTHDHKVFVITYQPLTTKARGSKTEKKENLEIHRIGWFGYNWFHKLEPYPLLEFLYLFPGLFIYCLIFFIKYNKKIDVIHAHGINAAFIAMILSRIYKKRSIMSIHAIYYLEKRHVLSSAFNYILSSFNYILPLAERSKNDLFKAGIPEDKIIMYRQWVNQEIFKPFDKKECKKKLMIDIDDFIVLFVGRLIEKKGVRVILEAASMLSNNIKFIFIGDGPLENEIKSMSSKHRNIQFVGKTQINDLVVYYNAADIFIIPSQYEEGFARVTLEALSCGTPIIAANKGCLPEMINSSVGVLIEPNAENITKIITFFYNHPGELAKLQLNCRNYAVENFSEKNAKLIENVCRII